MRAVDARYSYGSVERALKNVTEIDTRQMATANAFQNAWEEIHVHADDLKAEILGFLSHDSGNGHKPLRIHFLFDCNHTNHISTK